MKVARSYKPIAKCFDYEDGRTTQTAFLSGYDVGDRLLEGVMFKCVLDNHGFLEVSVADGSASYMEKLNVDYWLGVALQVAEGYDVFCDNESGSGEELCFVEDK
jgi:hypothetical protein